MKNMASLDDPINATSGVPKKNVLSTKGAPIGQPLDTVHVKSDAGYKIAVGRNSNYDKMAKNIGSVPGNLRPGGAYTEKTDPLAVSNFAKKDAMRKAQMKRK